MEASRKTISQSSSLPGEILSFSFIILTFISFLSSSDQIPSPDQDHPILIKGGTIHTVANGIMENTDLLFDNGKILLIGKDLNISSRIEIIDATGQHVFPGLISAGSTLGLQEIGAVRATRDYAEVGDMNPNARSNVSYNPDSELIPISRSNGILLALSVPRSGLISGTSSLMMLDGWTWEDATLKHPVGVHIFWPSMNLPKNSKGKGWRKTLACLKDYPIVPFVASYGKEINFKMHTITWYLGYLQYEAPQKDLEEIKLFSQIIYFCILII